MSLWKWFMSRQALIAECEKREAQAEVMCKHWEQASKGYTESELGESHQRHVGFLQKQISSAQQALVLAERDNAGLYQIIAEQRKRFADIERRLDEALEDVRKFKARVEEYANVRPTNDT